MNLSKNAGAQKIKPKIIVILGPTASGKSDWALKIAKKFRGEIISADSRQVYRGMDIGTNKIQISNFLSQNNGSRRINTKVFQPVFAQKIPHYLIDIVNPNENFNAAFYQKLAVGIIKDIQKRSKIPLLVGGTGLYLAAVVDNLKFPKIKADEKLREKLEKKSAKQLFAIYKKLDFRGAEIIDKNNKRRLVRAVEVCLKTKNPFSEIKEKGDSLFDALQIGIKLNKKELKKKIQIRIDSMFKRGLEKEVKRLAQKYGFGIPSMKTIGYQEWSEYFENKISREELKNKIVYHTIQYAKRQMTWFRKDRRIKWIKNFSEAENLVRRYLRPRKS